MTAILRHFDRQAAACRELGSPFTGRLAALHPLYLDRSTAVGDRILDWAGDPQADIPSVRLFGGLHALVLAGDDADLARAYPPHAATDEQLGGAVRAALVRHEAALMQALDGPPQTNEAARSAMLLPGFLTLAGEVGRPFDILELGASAGVNLGWDAYRYSLGGRDWGPADAALRIAVEAQGLPDFGGRAVAVIRRRACDRAPLDPRRPAERLRLMSYVWADQAARLARLATALDEVIRRDIRVERADAADFAEARLAEPPLPGALRVVVHTIVWQYLQPAIRRRIEAAILRAAAAGPVAWLRLEPDGRTPDAGLHLTALLDGPTSRRDRLLARADFHGRWINWCG
ncbi:DUF2332 domain-containing protein [Labrys wisconsinensis]|uniref:DUF2332 domain-containing protein n=1 Tax=Labrys wisconsinensis TaxID=425677 RepID=A0ABU0J2D5_9HYPH|nr:DUF2332 family protein [Labrys wisconsinensis]MDQ0468412.1 hypothetical protein [Labrys wisconsinensis]